MPKIAIFMVIIVKFFNELSILFLNIIVQIVQKSIFKIKKAGFTALVV